MRKITLCLTIFVLSVNLLSAQKKINFTHGWQFTNVLIQSGDSVRPDVGKKWDSQFTSKTISVGDTSIGNPTLAFSQEMKKLEGKKWGKCDLPHNAFKNPLIINNPKQGLTYYKKAFTIPKSYQGKRLTLEFEGAMQIAWIWVNGKFVRQHSGGYLPFTIDLTKKVKYGKRNNITVKVDNRANPLVPPGKPVLSLDFLYYSGIYRDVWLRVHDPLHITNPNFIDKVAGGGIFVTYPKVSDSLSVVQIKTDVKNQYKRTKEFDLRQELLDAKGNRVASVETTSNTLKQGKDKETVQKLTVKNPHLWSPQKPYLYTLKTSVIHKGKNVDVKKTKIGIRSIVISKKTGVLINGKPIIIQGSNRHQSYPRIGNALSNNAQTRDAILIKKSGLNCIRLSHYPQDPSFYDACDSLGILLIDCIPGWQIYNTSETFIKNTLCDIRQTIRRDRNHPSVFLWEMSLNEAYPPAEFRCKQVKVAKSEFPGSNFYTSGDSYFTKACYDVPYDDWNGDPGDRDNTTYPDHAYLAREYGDFEFGGAKSTSRVFRADGQNALLQQAWNIQWEHNRNREKYPRMIGDLTWAFFDGMPGYLIGMEGWGLMDIKRLPKFSYYFFQSQKRDGEPMVFIANYWNGKDTTDKVIVYSNCDEVALFVNGKEIARQLPDMGSDSPYSTDWDKGGHPFNGGNANALSQAPFTFFNVSYQPGELKAVGYKNGEEKTVMVRNTPGEISKISLIEDTQKIPLKPDGADVVFIRAVLTDKEGTPVYTADNDIHFSVTGPATLVNSGNVKAEAGVASVLLRADNKPGKIKIVAEGKGLIADHLVIETKK